MDERMVVTTVTTAAPTVKTSISVVDHNDEKCAICEIDETQSHPAVSD